MEAVNILASTPAAKEAWIAAGQKRRNNHA